MTEAVEKIPYVQQGQFGFTSDPKHFLAAQQYREAMVADGWSIRPTYGSESVDRASSLEKEGFNAMIVTRDNTAAGGRHNFQAEVSIWGPDRLSINTPELYGFQKLQDGLTTCHECGAKGVETQRYSFAGRCCEACLPKMRAATEQPGWCD